MEDVVLSFPKADMALVMQFASRMGWHVDSKSIIIDRFINSCRGNSDATISDDEIMNEVRAVRYTV